MNSNELWLLKDSIKNGTYTYNIGDQVILSHKNKNGYPKKLSFDVLYEVKSIEGQCVYLIEKGGGNSYTNSAIKVHKYYVMPKGMIRDLKLQTILK